VERKQAQQVFEAKQLYVNPRKPFYITLGALGCSRWARPATSGTKCSRKACTSCRPLGTTPGTTPCTACSRVAAAPAATPAATMSPPWAPRQRWRRPSLRPGRGGACRCGTGVGACGRHAQRRAPCAPDCAGDCRRHGGGRARAARRESDITITPARVQADPLLESAYQAFNAGDLARARDEYQQVLRNSPTAAMRCWDWRRWRCRPSATTPPRASTRA